MYEDLTLNVFPQEKASLARGPFSRVCIATNTCYIAVTKKHLNSCKADCQLGQTASKPVNMTFLPSDILSKV